MTDEKPKFNPWPLVIGGVAVLALVAFIALPNMLRSPGYANESAAIGACKTFASSEDTFKRVDYDSNGVLEYATTLKALYGDGKINLVDRAFANAEYSSTATPKAGYFFKVLNAQGPGAKGGAMSYLDEKGNMTKGYALLAIPASYDHQNNSFMISHEGTVYQKDLNMDAEKQNQSITVFDPTGWMAAE